MKKKKLLLILLALAIVTSVTAGTLAVYTKTLEVGTDVVIKKFAMSVGGEVDSGAASIKLAPKDKESYSFSVSNSDIGGIAEVPLEFKVSIDFSDAVSKMTGLTAKLTGNGINGNVQINDGKYEFSFRTEAGKKVDNNYKLEIEWKDADNKAQTDEGTSVLSTTGLKISVNATQIP